MSKRVQIPDLVVRDLKTALGLKADDELPKTVRANVERFWYACSLLGCMKPALDPRLVALFVTFRLEPLIVETESETPKAEAKAEVKAEAKPEPEPAAETIVSSKPHAPDDWRKILNTETVLIINGGRGRPQKRLGTVVDVLEQETGRQLVIRSGGQERTVPADQVKIQ